MAKGNELRKFLQDIRELRKQGKHEAVLKSVDALAGKFPGSAALRFEKSHAL